MFVLKAMTNVFEQLKLQMKAIDAEHGRLKKYLSKRVSDTS